MTKCGSYYNYLRNLKKKYRFLTTSLDVQNQSLLCQSSGNFNIESYVWKLLPSRYRNEELLLLLLIRIFSDNWRWLGQQWPQEASHYRHQGCTPVQRCPALILPDAIPQSPCLGKMVMGGNHSQRMKGKNYSIHRMNYMLDTYYVIHVI